MKNNRRMKARNDVYKKVLPDIERIVKKHGVDAAKFAINRWLTVTRKQIAVRRKQEALREELVELGKRLR